MNPISAPGTDAQHPTQADRCCQDCDAVIAAMTPSERAAFLGREPMPQGAAPSLAPHLDAWYGRNDLLEYADLDAHDAGEHAAVMVTRCLMCQYVFTTTPEERAFFDQEFERGWEEASYQAAWA